MRTKWMAGIMILALVGAPALLAGKGEADAGKTVYNKKCATCHGKDGSPNAGIAKMMKVEMKHLGAKEVQDLSDEELAKIINEGTGKMRPVKGLSKEDVANVIAYVRTFEKK